MDTELLKKKLEEKGYAVSVFPTMKEAAAYLNETVRGKRVTFGGSQTLTDLDLRHSLAEHNTVYVPDFPREGENFRTTAMAGMDADVYFLSANAVSADGDIINIDGTGNRLAGSLYGHEKVYYIIGMNKVGGTLEEAIDRARNVASPKNALRLHRNTPCALAVRDRLEAEFRTEYGVTGDIDQLEWQKFIEGLDAERLGTHCYDCKSPDRICRSLLVHLTRPKSAEAEVVLIEEPMGF